MPATTPVLDSDGRPPSPASPPVEMANGMMPSAGDGPAQSAHPTRDYRTVTGIGAGVVALGAAGMAIVAGVTGGVAGAAFERHWSQGDGPTAPAASAGPVPSTPPIATTAADMVVRLDELPLPNFTVSGSAARAGTPSDLAANDPTVVTAAAAAPIATTTFTRPVADISTTNGPITITVAAATTSTVAGASALLAAVARHWDGLPAASPTSGGMLGDEHHADVLLVTDPATGTRLVEAAVMWRTGTAVNLTVIRGRDGGTGVSDAILIAAVQQRNETG